MTYSIDIDRRILIDATAGPWTRRVMRSARYGDPFQVGVYGSGGSEFFKLFNGVPDEAGTHALIVRAPDLFAHVVSAAPFLVEASDAAGRSLPMRAWAASIVDRVSDRKRCEIDDVPGRFGSTSLRVQVAAALPAIPYAAGPWYVPVISAECQPGRSIEASVRCWCGTVAGRARRSLFIGCNYSQRSESGGWRNEFIDSQLIAAAPDAYEFTRALHPTLTRVANATGGGSPDVRNLLSVSIGLLGTIAEDRNRFETEATQYAAELSAANERNTGE